MQAVPFILHAYTIPFWTYERINFYYYQQPIETFNEAISKWAKSLSWSDLSLFLYSMADPIQHAIRQPGCYSIFIMIWKDFSFCTLGLLASTHTHTHTHTARVRLGKTQKKKRRKKAKRANRKKWKKRKKLKESNIRVGCGGLLVRVVRFAWSPFRLASPSAVLLAFVSYTFCHNIYNMATLKA